MPGDRRANAAEHAEHINAAARLLESGMAAAWREKMCSVSTRSSLTWTDGPREHG